MKKGNAANKKLMIAAISFIAVFVIGIAAYLIISLVTRYPFKGAGTKSSPYLIATKKDLINFESIPKKTLNDQKGKYFKLAADIDLEGYEWTPVGYKTYKFYGQLDGGGYVISNFKIKDAGDNVGFFAQIEKGNDDAGVYNLRIKNATLSTARTINSIGILTGFAGADITNCFVEGSLTVTGAPANTGTVAGYTTAVITGCESGGTIDISASERTSSTLDWHIWPAVGGLAGNTVESITDSVNRTKINMARVESADATDKFLHVGGICGNARGAIYKNLINYADINAVGALGGIIGTIGSEDTVVESCQNYGSLYSTSDILLDIGGVVARTYTYGRPEIRNSYNGGKITLNSMLKKIGGEVQGMLNCFAGGVLATGNAHVYNSVSTGDIDVYGEAAHYVGGVVGGANGIIKNSYNTGNISVRSQKGSVIAGGVAGVAQENNDVTISSCYNAGAVYIKADETFVDFLAGGIIGFNMRKDNRIQNNYFDADVAKAFHIPDGFTGSLYWYGEEVPGEAENIDSPTITGNVGVSTGVLQGGKPAGLIEYSDGSDVNAVWVFETGRYPKLYWQ